MDYRREIDGLRAVAVTAVILGHADFQIAGWHPFSGGFVGVDVFFVISGYLITSILMREGRISLLSFYERRARRILPALVLVCAASAVAAWFLLSPAQLKNFAASLFATAAFASNVFFWLDGDYFAEATALKPLFHTWSLGVEEQFYILFPLLLMGLRWIKWPAVWAFAILGLLSLGAASILGPQLPGANFYLLPSRAWELLAGALLTQLPTPKLTGWRAALPSVGLVAILAAVLTFNAATPHPGLLTLLPVIGACLIIRYAGTDLTTRLLSSAPFVAIGLISYSLYLWHQPVFAFARVGSLDGLTQWHYAGLIVLAVVLATLTYRFVEQPFRRRQVVKSPVAWSAAGVGLAAVIGMGAAGVAYGGFPNRLPEALRGFQNVPVGYTNSKGEDCFRTPCIIGADGVQPSVMLIGDSHAAALAQSLDAALQAEGLAGRVEADGDIFLGREFPDWYVDAAKWNAVLAREREAVFSDDIKTVILAGRWTLRLLNVPFDNGQGGVERLDSTYTGRSPEQVTELAEAIREGIEQLAGKRVIIVYPVPEVGWDVPDRIYRVALRGADISTDFDLYRTRNKLATDLFDSLLSDTTIAVKPSEILCDTFVAGRCATYTQDGILYHDDDHLSAYGAELVMDELVARTKQAWGGIAP